MTLSSTHMKGYAAASREVADAQKNLRKATIHDASLCDDPDQAAGTLVFAVEGADNGGRWSRMASAIEAKVCTTLQQPGFCRKLCDAACMLRVPVVRVWLLPCSNLKEALVRHHP